MSDHAETLCDRAGAGDLEAVSELVSLYYERIFAWLRRLCGNDHDAADLTQRTFFKVWTSLASYQRRSSFSTWLHGIGHHVYLAIGLAQSPDEFRFGFQRGSNDYHQLIRCKGLLQERRSRQRRIAVADFTAETARVNDLQLRFRGSEFFRQLQSGGPVRDHHVGQQQIDLKVESFPDFQRLRLRLGGENLVAGVEQNLAHHLAYRGIVFHEQNGSRTIAASDDAR